MNLSLYDISIAITNMQYLGNDFECKLANLMAASNSEQLMKLATEFEDIIKPFIDKED